LGHGPLLGIDRSQVNYCLWLRFIGRSLPVLSSETLSFCYSYIGSFTWLTARTGGQTHAHFFSHPSASVTAHGHSMMRPTPFLRTHPPASPHNQHTRLACSKLEAFRSSIPPSNTIYLDLEGNCLSRHWTISLVTILIRPQRVVRLIDVLALRKQAFTTALNNGKTLRSILKDADIPKSTWDVRNEADALWALYQVGLAGVTDIQLLENASRAGDKTYVHGLGKSTQFNLKLGFMEIHRWIRIKKEI